MWEFLLCNKTCAVLVLTFTTSLVSVQATLTVLKDSRSEGVDVEDCDWFRLTSCELSTLIVDMRRIIHGRPEREQQRAIIKGV